MMTNKHSYLADSFCVHCRQINVVNGIVHFMRLYTHAFKLWHVDQNRPIAKNGNQQACIEFKLDEVQKDHFNTNLFCINNAVFGTVGRIYVNS